MTKNIFTRRILITVVFIAIIVLITYRTSNNTAQPVTAEFGGVSLTIELATTTVAQERGLGGRTNVPEGYGMLFIFDKANRYGFWMKDMLVPIDIFWLGSDMRVVSFISDVATSTYPHVFYPARPALYVLETAAGFTEQNSVTTGTLLRLQNFKLVSN